MTKFAPPAIEPLGSPTRIRYLVVFVAFLSSWLLYLDRFCVSLAERYIREDLGLDNWQMAVFLSTFFWSYGLAQVPSGWFTDRFGARIMMTVYIVAWSLFLGLTGLATGFGLLILWRFCFGVAQAGAYPTSASLLRNWIPLPSRGLANSIVALGGRVGAAVAPPLTALLIVMFVPLSVPSTLAKTDLLDVPRFAYELSRPQPAGEPESPRRKVLSALQKHFSPATIQLLGEQRQLYEQHLTPSEKSLPPEKLPESKTLALEIARNGFTGPGTGGPVELSPQPAGSETLAADINTALAAKDFFVPEHFPRSILEREALDLLTLDADGRHVPIKDLSPERLLRLHRLALESALPEFIGKLYVSGWRPALAVYGFLGLLVAAAFWISFRNRPEQHAWCNESEQRLIVEGSPRITKAAGSSSSEARKLFLAMIRHRSLWLICLSQFGTNFAWGFLGTWLPRFLSEVYRVPLEERGWMVTIPFASGWLGMLAGGRLTDWLAQSMGLRWGRALPLALTRFIGMAAFLACLTVDSAWMATFCFAFVALGTDMGTPSVWCYKQDVGGRYVASILGWGNMWGNFGMAASPLVLQGLVGSEGRWDYAFLACAFAFFVSGVAALGVDARIPIMPDTPEKLDNDILEEKTAPDSKEPG